MPAVTIEAVAAALDITEDEASDVVVDAPHLRTALAMDALAGPAPLIDEAVSKTTHGEAALDAYLRTYVSHGLADPLFSRLTLSALTPGAAKLCHRTPTTLDEHVVPTFDLMFRRVVEKLTSDWGEDGLPQGIHPRRLVFISHLAAVGLVAVATNNIDIGGSIMHDHDDLLDEMSRALAAPTTMMRQLAALNDVATELAAIRDEPTLIERVPPLLQSSLDIEQALLMLLDGDGRLGLASRQGRQIGEQAQAQLREALRANALKPPPYYRRCLDQDRTVVIEKPHEDPDWPRQDNEELQALADLVQPRGPLVATPVRIRGEQVGVVAGHVESLGPLFDRRDVARIETFASMVGMALDNVRFYATLNAKVEERTKSLREAQATLLQSAQLASLGQLVAGVAHELNTPLGAVHSARATLQSAVERLKQKRGDTERLLGVVDSSSQIVGAGVERVRGVVSSLKSFVHLDEAAEQRIDLRKSVEDALTMLNNQVPATVRIQRELGDIPELVCKPAMVNQMLFNLLLNAVQAIDAIGLVTVRTSASDGHVLVDVIDDGCGMSEEQQEHMFTPGYTTKGVGVGTGLGLSICHQVVRQHGGKIDVQTQPGVGTRVTVSLPVSNEK